jgi:hypothetical protein
VCSAVDAVTLELYAVKTLYMDLAGEWCSLYDAEVSALRTLASDGIGDVPCIYSCKADSALSQASICMNLLNLGSADRWATKGRPCPEPWLAHVAYTLLQVKWLVCTCEFTKA